MNEPEELQGVQVQVPGLVVDNRHVLCPDCETQINVGRVGIQNYYKRHKGSAQCAANKKKKKTEDATEKTKQNALSFFRPRAPVSPAVPPTVKAPTRLQPHAWPTISSLSTTLTLPAGDSKSRSAPAPQIMVGCPIGIKLLHKFRARIESLPPDVGVANEDHPLAAFAGDPEGCIEDGEDAWETFDGPLNTLLQKPPEELRHLVRVGEKGLIGLCRLLEYLVTSHNIGGVLLEGKVERLMRAIDDV
jgi:hypothetical protein